MTLPAVSSAMEAARQKAAKYIVELRAQYAILISSDKLTEKQASELIMLREELDICDEDFETHQHIFSEIREVLTGEAKFLPVVTTAERRLAVVEGAKKVVEREWRHALDEHCSVNGMMMDLRKRKTGIRNLVAQHAAVYPFIRESYEKILSEMLVDAGSVGIAEMDKKAKADLVGIITKAFDDPESS